MSIQSRHSHSANGICFITGCATFTMGFSDIKMSDTAKAIPIFSCVFLVTFGRAYLANAILSSLSPQTSLFLHETGFNLCSQQLSVLDPGCSFLAKLKCQADLHLYGMNYLIPEECENRDRYTSLIELSTEKCTSTLKSLSPIPIVRARSISHSKTKSKGPIIE